MMGDYKSVNSPDLSYREEDSLSNRFSVLNELRLNEKLCDTKLKISDRIFPVHRAVLASCSPFFRALFTNGMQETQREQVEINDVSVVAMNKLIEYAYTGNVHVESSNVEELMVTADKFSVNGIVKICTDAILTYLTPSNCFHYLSFATVYGFLRLYEKTQHYIRVNFEDIGLNNYDILDVDVEEFEDLLTADTLNVRSEEFVFETLERWINHDAENRSKLMPRLICCVRLGLVPTEFFTEKVRRNKFVRDNEALKPTLDATWSYLCNLDKTNSSNRSVDLENPLVRPRMPNDVLFAIGGWSGGNPITFFESYDTRSDRWYTHAFVEDNIPRAYHGLATIEQCVYIIGGFDGTSYFSSVRCFQPGTREWKEVAPMHYQRCYVSVAVMDKCIYACGGYNGRHRQRTAERYDPKNNQWTLISKMHLARSDSSATSLDGKLYIAGGFNGEECLLSAEVYDPRSDEWTMITPMRKARSGVCLVAYNEAVYALGGFNGIRRQACGERYDPDRKAWTPIKKMFTPRSNFAAIIMDKMIFVIGGFNGTTTIPHVECYDAESNEWFDASDMNINRSALSACVVSNLPNIAHYTYHGSSKSVRRHSGEGTRDESEEEEDIDEDDEDDDPEPDDGDDDEDEDEDM